MLDQFSGSLDLRLEVSQLTLLAFPSECGFETRFERARVGEWKPSLFGPSEVRSFSLGRFFSGDRPKEVDGR